MHDFKITAVGAEDFLTIINQDFIKKSVSGCPTQSMCGKAELGRDLMQYLQQTLTANSEEMPLPIYTPCIRVNDGSAEDYLELISQYFRQDYNNLEIFEFLKLHGVSFSLSTLKRRLASLGLSRKTNISDDELRSAIEKELGKSGCFVG
ncbi:hypothetical protein pdam_00006870 [Pocillopora damicornis]|uniref:Uncharacterized protein n=1 Tax=Pocillopora damicornis TaxID=46731 RepID=A0A3M6TPG5_POCDA|nr:hypothetical protein pdam_00006870 [Pocillopora damicornis]